MTWIVWRQHRAEGLILLVVLALSGVFLLITGREMWNSFQQLGLSNCERTFSENSSCIGLSDVFYNQYNIVLGAATLLLALSPLLGALVGAPLVAREVEQRTHLLIWTQSITRMRWLTVKLALVLSVGLLASGALMALLIWWNGPSALIGGSFGTKVYDTAGPVWLGATLLALTLGVFAGALTRRTIVAIFLAIALFVAVRASVELLGRPNFETPVTVTTPVDQQNPPALSLQDWRLSNGFIDAQGNRSTNLKYACPSSETNMQCLQANGVRARYTAYQPADRFWTFQWIETGIYVVFSVLALGASVWLVRRLN